MIVLSLETDDPEMSTELIAKNTPDFRLSLEKESSRQGAFETKLLFDFLLEVSAGVTSELVAHYIISNVAPRARKLRVNGVSVTTEAECKKALAADVIKPDTHESE